MRNQQSEYAGHYIECAECGHLHFDTVTATFTACPLADEGCDCDEVES